MTVDIETRLIRDARRPSANATMTTNRLATALLALAGAGCSRAPMPAAVRATAPTPAAVRATAPTPAAVRATAPTPAAVRATAPTPAAATAASASALLCDASTYGASPDNPDNAPAIQAAHDAAAAAVAAIASRFYSGIRPNAVVYIPGAKAPYTLKSPVWVEQSGVEFRGDGTSTQLYTTNGAGFPVFINGLYRTGSGNVPGAAYRPDLWSGGAPKLDSSVVTAANQKWGFNCGADSWVVSHGSVFSHGSPSLLWPGLPDKWAQTRQFTIEFAAEGFASGQIPGGAYLFGVGDTNPNFQTPAGAGCWFLSTAGTNTYKLYLYTQATRFGPVVAHAFTFSSGAATGVQRITIQPDLVTSAVTAFVNGTQVAVSQVTGTLLANSTLNENQFYPFTLASHGDGTPGAGGANFAVYGLSISKSLRYATLGIGRPQTPHPQFSGTSANGSGAVTLTLPGSPTGGTYTVTYGGVTSAPISPTASAATLQAALQAMSSIGSGNVLVNGSGSGNSTLQYTITTANGFTFAGAQGQCNGAGLTGSTIRDSYRYYPTAQGYPYNQDAYALGYFGFTENPSATPSPRGLTIPHGGAIPGGGSSYALLLHTGSNNAIANANKFSNMVVRNQGAYGTSILLGHNLNTTFSNLTMLGGTWGLANLPFGANYTLALTDCTFGGNEAGVFGHSAVMVMDRCNFIVNNRYALLLAGCSVQAKHITVGNYGSDPCAFAAVYSAPYGGTYTYEDVSLDLEGGGGFSLALFYNESIAYTSNVLKVSGVYAGSMGWAPIFKLRSVYGPPTWPVSWLDAESIAASAFGGAVDVDGPGWVGEVRNTTGDHGPYVQSSMANGRPAVTVVDRRSQTFPRFGSWIAGTAIVKPPSQVDGQYQEFRVAADGIHGSEKPPKWAGLNAIQADPDSSLAAYGLDHTSIAATLSGQATSGGYLTGQNGAAPASATLFGGPVLGGSTTLTLAGAGLGGAYALAYGGQTTAGIAPRATATTIQAALQGLSSIGSGNVLVGGNAGGPYTITFAGAMARLAGAALGLSVDGSGLTATGPSAAVKPGWTSYITFGGAAGGTFTLATGGKTTAPLAWNATGPQVQAALLAIGVTGTYGIPYLVPVAQPGIYYVINANITVNASGLTGGAVATLEGTTVPSTYYVALSTTPSYSYSGIVSEPPAGTSGYTRVALANTAASFGMPSAGAMAAGAAITFPAATGTYSVRSIAIMASPTAKQSIAVLQLAQPLIVTPGMTPTIPAGALTITHVPYSGHFAGGMSDYAWGKVYGLFFGGASFTPPTTYYAALSTAPLSKTATSLAEPPGNGYARQALPNTPATWAVVGSNNFYGQAGDARNAASIAFPAPTGPWGRCVAAPLADAPSGGNVWFFTSMPNAVSPTAGGPAPAFAANALTLAAS